MKIKVSGATELQIDYLVAKCKGHDNLRKNPHGPYPTAFIMDGPQGHSVYLSYLNYSTDWALGGPIIEREKIGILFYVDHIPDVDEPIWVASCGGERALGDTPLIAAMRCYITLELGDEVEIPEDLATTPRDSVFKKNGKWFFYAEDWASVYGPFNTETIARFALLQYCNECLG